MSGPIAFRTEHDGQLARIVLDRPKGNILDRAMIAALRAQLAVLTAEPGRCKLLAFEGAGAHFSFGASVEDHKRETAAEFLTAFDALFLELEALAIPTIALVRGQCLGGAAELAMACGMVICAPAAKLGVPEIKLGVFPPVAAVLLPWRIGGPRAARMILSGESVDAETAVAWGLADTVKEDPEAALQALFAREFAPRSAIALRHAYRAARLPLADLLRDNLPRLEKQYLNELMAARDPHEGIASFLEKREPRWEDR